MRLERYDDAANAYSEVLRLLGENPSRRAEYGEALVAAAGGVVTDQARAAFDKALAEQPGQPQARFYLALAAEQDGKKAEAIQDYESLVADGPADAPWVDAVKARLAALKGAPPPQSRPPAVAGAWIGGPDGDDRGMVERLATRLANNGGSIEEWSRLIRAYSVLHETR